MSFPDIFLTIKACTTNETNSLIFHAITRTRLFVMCALEPPLSKSALKNKPQQNTHSVIIIIVIGVDRMGSTNSDPELLDESFCDAMTWIFSC
jgi:hypothetical protein